MIHHTRTLPLLSTALLVLPMLTATGCTGVSRMKAERDALFAQNQQLQSELDRARQDLQFERSQPSVAAPPPPLLDLGNSGFEGIQDVEVAQNAAGELALRLPSDVLFPAGKAELRTQAKASLSKVADVIKSDYAGSTIRIEGYTDTDPIKKSGWKDNLALSLERAASVHRHLASQGVDPSRLYAAGFGSENPLSSKAKSRRVEIVVVR